ncbi:hypothetical protein [Halomarina oriensis]|uniref:Uncharacterized protein n=1 Tax=Halomarina oriensis TaxID=671145 RepID=A0A6B0GQ10_9EURY|nr:hypothetical protein [Halomarina oriensis]MWG34205.1 hypothetical protein [Halomarina oriensis]
MAVVSAARYTVSALELTLALGLLGIAAVHALMGVPTAFLPAVGGVGLLGGALALSPVGRRRFRQHATARDDVLLFVGTLAVGALTLGGFLALGVVF